MDVPELGIARHFGSARQFVGTGAQEVAPDDVPKGPTASTVFGHADQKLGSRLLLLVFTRNISK